MSKVAGIIIDNYDVAYNNYKKILVTVLNSLFFRVFRVKINEYDRMMERFDPLFEFLLKIESKKNLILCLNILFYKLSNEEYESIKSEELNQRISINHSTKYEKTVNWLITDGSPEIVLNDGGTNCHSNMSGCGYYFSLDRTHVES